MNQYSHFVRKRQPAFSFSNSDQFVSQRETINSLNKQLSKLGWFSLILLSAFSFLIFSYAFLINQIISKKYSLEVLNKQVDESSVTLELKGSELENIISPSALSTFAKKIGMVEAKDNASVYLTDQNLSSMDLELKQNSLAAFLKRGN